MRAIATTRARFFRGRQEGGVPISRQVASRCLAGGTPPARLCRESSPLAIALGRELQRVPEVVPGHFTSGFRGFPLAMRLLASVAAPLRIT